MKITELLLAELDSQAVGIRKTLERLQEGKNGSRIRNRCRSTSRRRYRPTQIDGWLTTVFKVEDAVSSRNLPTMLRTRILWLRPCRTGRPKIPHICTLVVIQRDFVSLHI